MKELLARERERREARARAVALLWPRRAHGLGYGSYLARLLGAWVVVEAVPLACYVATRRSVAGLAHAAVFSGILIAPSLAWTLLGARLAWGGLGISHVRTIARGAASAVRALALSWAVWVLFNMIGPRLPPSWAMLAVGVEWLHIWMLPSTIILGAIAGHVQWHSFYSTLLRASSRRRRKGK